MTSASKNQCFEICLDISSIQCTELLGISIGENAQAGDVYLLDGDLGAGKTTLTQFIGKGLQVPPSCYITSPTFSLLHEYQGRLSLYHFDLYRLTDETEMEDLGFLEYIYGGGVSVIEWPDRLGRLEPKKCLQIRLIMQFDGTRWARLKTNSASWGKRLGQLLEKDLASIPLLT